MAIKNNFNLLNFVIAQVKNKKKPKPNRIFARYVGIVVKPRITVQTADGLINLHFADEAKLKSFFFFSMNNCLTVSGLRRSNLKFSANIYVTGVVKG